MVRVPSKAYEMVPSLGVRLFANKIAIISYSFVAKMSGYMSYIAMGTNHILGCCVYGNNNSTMLALLRIRTIVYFCKQIVLNASTIIRY